MFSGPTARTLASLESFVTKRASPAAMSTPISGSARTVLPPAAVTRACPSAGRTSDLKTTTYLFAASAVSALALNSRTAAHNVRTNFIQPSLGTQWLFRSACKTLRDRRDRDDLVSCARRAPRAVEDDAVQRLPVPAAEERAVQALRSRDRPEELAVRREDVHRLARRDIHVAFLIDGGSVPAFAALQLAELALVGQRPVRIHVERIDNRAIGRIQLRLVRAEDDPVGERDVFPVLRDHALRIRVEDAAVSRAGDREVDAAFRVSREVVDDAADALERLAVELRRQHPALRLQRLDAPSPSR